jgi:prephenate dehydratase
VSGPRVAFLGPEGTYTHEALVAAAAGAAFEAVAAPTIVESIAMVGRDEVPFAFAPFENSIEGSVRATLDTLAFDAPWGAIVGEHDHPIRHSLIARPGVEIGDLAAVVSHPQANAQCARFLRERLPGVDVRSVESTVEAVRIVSRSSEPIAALGSSAAAAAYDCSVLQEGVEDEPDNVTRFVWIAKDGAGAAPATGAPWKTSLVFAELGADHPGALVEALEVFSGREVNLTRIESRPLRRGLGRYMFFVDLEGSVADEPVTAALEDLRTKAESVRVLGSYPVGGPSPLG